jgi:hypothetical protein
MPHDPIELAGHIAAQCRCDFKVMTADRQIHKLPPVTFKVADMFHQGGTRVKGKTFYGLS